MPAEYYLNIKDASGVVQAQIDNYRELTYSKRVWEPGLLKFKLDGDSDKIPFLTDNALVEVYRRNAAQGIDWYIDFYGIYRKSIQETPKDVDTFQGFCPGQMTMLSWATIYYPDKVNNRSSFTQVPAESLMKTLVKYNVTTDFATVANGRILSWPIPGIQIEPDLGRGNVLDWKCPYKNLLTELQSIAKIAGGDFDFVSIGPKAWEFRFYPGQLGTDRSNVLLFSLEYGNMGSPRFELDRINEATVAVVGGRGDSKARNYVVVYSDSYNPDTNYIETFVPATEQDTAAYLTAKGEEFLYKVKARNQFTFDVLQTPSAQYGREYFWAIW